MLCADPNDRVILVEDVPEIECPIVNHVKLRITENVTWAALGRAALSLVPDRLVFGDIRNSNSATAFVDVWGSGPSAGVASTYANNAKSALRMLHRSCFENSSQPKDAFPIVGQLIAESVHVSVWLDRSDQKIHEVVGVTGYDSVTHQYTFEELGSLARGGLK